MKLSPQVIARIFDYLDFPKVITIVNKYPYGNITILPYISNAYSNLPTINPYNITRCCRLKRLILPNCNYINNNILMMLPELEVLTIKAGSYITADIFEYLPSLKSLEILTENKFQLDSVLNRQSVQHLKGLQRLNTSNCVLTNDDIIKLINLEVLILNNNDQVTPEILNSLPNLQLCLLNGVLIKYHDSLKNKLILRNIITIKPTIRVKIYGLNNTIHKY